MNSKGRGEINFVILGCTNGVSSTRQVTVEDVFGGGDEVLSGYGRATWDHGRCTTNGLVEERRCATGRGEGSA